MTTFDEELIISLERDYPLVNVRPIADRISKDPTVHHPEGALKASVKKSQQKQEADTTKSREVQERRVSSERVADDFNATYVRFLDWFNGHLLRCFENKLTSPEMDEYFGYQICEYEQKRGKEMHPYFAKIMEYHRLRWRSGTTREEIAAEEASNRGAIRLAKPLQAEDELPPMEG